MHLEDYEVYDNQGDLVEMGDSEVELYSSSDVVTVDHWQETVNRAQANVQVPLQRELILTARAFWHERNFNIALVNAAIACEMLLYRLLHERLVRTRKETLAKLQKANNPCRVNLLIKHSIVTGESEDKIASIRRTFVLRNEVVHWKQAVPVSADDAEVAIRSAQFLEFLLQTEI